MRMRSGTCGTKKMWTFLKPTFFWDIWLWLPAVVDVRSARCSTLGNPTQAAVENPAWEVFILFKTIVVTLSWESPLSQLAGLSNLKGKYDVAVRSDWDVERVDNRLILKRRCQMSILGFLISNQKDHCVICFIRYKMVLMHPTNLTNVISFNFEMKWSLKSNMCSSQIRNSEKSLSVPWSCTDFQKFKQKAFDTRVISSSICDKPCIYHMTPIKIIHKKPGKNNRKLFNNSSVFPF